MANQHPLKSVSLFGSRTIYLEETSQICTLYLPQHVRLSKPHIRKKEQSHPKSFLLDQQLHLTDLACLLPVHSIHAINAISAFLKLLGDFLTKAGPKEMEPSELRRRSVLWLKGAVMILGR
jgi:hypothetical protein